MAICAPAALSVFKTDEYYIYLDIKPLRTTDQRAFIHLRVALYGPGPATAKIASEDRQAALAPAIAASKGGDLASVARLVPTGVNHQPDFWDTASPEIRSMFLDNARTFPLSLTAPPQPSITCDMLRQIKIPVLITYGEDTRSFFRIASEGAARCIPGAQLVSIQGGRHLAIAQQPDAFNAVLLQFLAKAGSEPKP